MNHIYKTVFNKTTGQISVASENSKSYSKSSRNYKNSTASRVIVYILFATSGIALSTSAFSQACTAQNKSGSQDPVTANSGNTGTSYLQNSYIICSSSATVDVGKGGSNGYGTAGNNPNISRDTSLIERWTNSGNELNGTIGITVNENVTLKATEDSGLARGILYVRGGYYRNYREGNNDGQTTAEQAWIDRPRDPIYNNNNLLKVNIINNGTVENLAKVGSSLNQANPAAIGVDFGDMPVDVEIINNGTLSSNGANTISVVNYQTVPTFAFGNINFEDGYNLLGQDEYKYSENNKYLIKNSGNIVQLGLDDHTQGPNFNGAIAIGIAAAKSVEIINIGNIKSDTHAINATLANTIVDPTSYSSITNSGSITSENADGVHLTSKTFEKMGGGTPLATDSVTKVKLLSNLSLFNNMGEIQGGRHGLYNEGTIDVFNNWGTIGGVSSSIDTEDGLITNGINNFGTLKGNVLLGANTLNLLSSNLSQSNQPIVNGDITGGVSSSIIIGNIEAPTHFIHSNTFTAKVSNITISKNSSLTLSDGAIWTATSQSPDAIKINGDYISNGNTFLEGHTTNTGNIKIKEKLIPSILSITGDYVGQNGILFLNTDLDDDNSKTDKFVITGNATGSTEVEINNVNGSGAQTVNGIHVIQTGSSESNQTFYLNGGAISAGAYDYGLFRQKQVLIGTEFENVNDDVNTPDTYDNWYLKSHLRDNPTYTPDVGSYLAAETMGNTLFTSRLEDREGASQYQNLGNTDTGNVWVRAYGGHNQFKTMNDQLKTTGNSFVTQIGAGLITLGEEDQYNLGAMTGFATYDGKTRSNLTDRESKTKINGYSLGLYGTWYAHPVEKRGAYIDSWVLWNKFKNKIDTPDQNQYKYDSSGITASIEAGGDYLLNKNGKKDWWIQPQAQLIYQGVHADNFQDAQGVDINHGKDNLQARMGVKTYLNIPTDNNKLTSYRPYVALNFIHNTNPYSVVINDVRYENEGSANLGELKLGVEGQVTKNSQVWLNASYVAGSHSNQSYQGNIGWKYNF